MNNEFGFWTNRRRSQVLDEVIRGRTTIEQVSQTYGIERADVEAWVLQAIKAMEEALRVCENSVSS